MLMDQRKIIWIIVAFVAVLLGIFYFSSRSNVIVNYPSRGTDIIAFGDSLVDGVGSSAGNEGGFVTLLSRKIGRPIINLGNSGDTAADGLARINQLNEYNPKVVLLLLGGNDYLKKIPSEETFKNLSLLIQNIEKRGAVILLLGVRGGLLSDRFDSEFEKLRDTHQTAFVPNVLSGLLTNQQYMSDAIHPNDLGYQKIADRIYSVLESLLK
ncbi:MAG: GDSL-type esterase/lipase family protein [Minisyncoccia bacterium]